MRNKVTGHNRHFAYEFIHVSDLGGFTIPLRSLRFSAMTQQIGAILFANLLLFKNGPKRMSKGMRSQTFFGNSRRD